MIGVLVLLVPLALWGGIRYWRGQEEARRRETREAEAAEERRVRECGEVVLFYANNLGYIARQAVGRDELDQLIEGGVSPGRLSEILAERCAAVDGPILGHQFYGDARLPVCLPENLRTRHVYAVYPAYPKDAHLAILNRLGRLLKPKVVRSLLCSPGEGLNIRRCMDEGRVLLFNLSDGILGEQNAQLLGQLVVAKMQLAAMSRANAAKEERRPFYLYVDEFQSFCSTAASSYEKILSRARKYGLGLILAHQQTGQIGESVMREILGNVSTVVAFNVGASDARRLSREMVGEIDGQPVPTEPQELLSLKVGEAIVKLGRNVLPIRTLPVPGNGSERVRDEIVRRSRQRYGRPLRARATSPTPSPASGPAKLDDLDPGEVFRP